MDNDGLIFGAKAMLSGIRHLLISLAMMTASNI
jgi:hypothetical protein